MDEDTAVDKTDIYDEIPEDTLPEPPSLTSDDGLPLAQSDENGAPYSDPDDVTPGIPIDHPSADTDVDAQERYDEGLGGTAKDELEEE